MKCCKIICCYFGGRRNIHNTPADMVEFIKSSIENELNIENGFDTDVIFVINGDNGDFMNDYNNQKTKNGNILIEYRENIGASFGAYFDMVKKYHIDYDYFFFCEDDVLVYKDNYIKTFIETLNTDELNGFVCLAPLSKLYPLHSGGGCGLTSKNKFLEVHPLTEEKYIKLNPTYDDLVGYEINFTNAFCQKGFSIINVPHFSSLAINYEKHYGQKNHYDENMLNKEFIYKVGY
jgi:hypothetical protein